MSSENKEIIIQKLRMSSENKEIIIKKLREYSSMLELIRTVANITIFDTDSIEYVESEISMMWHQIRHLTHIIPIV